jgi:hypothetical protein
MRDKKLIETITVIGIPVAVFDDGSVEAAEIGPFPFSSSGYLSLYPMPCADRPIPAMDKIAKELEQLTGEHEKLLLEIEKRAEKRMKQKPEKDPITDYIHHSGDIISLISRAYFQNWDVSERLLKTALRLVKKCGKIAVPADFNGHHAWTAEFLRGKISAVQLMEPVLERCIDAKNLYELAVTPPIDNLVSTNGTYARLFEAKLPEMPPSAASFFYGRLYAAKHGTNIPDAEQTEETGPLSYFCHPINGDWTRHPLPDPNPLTLAADVPACGVCPLACHAHILVPTEGKENSYTKYCTITAIIAGLITVSTALDGGQAKPTDDDISMVEALVDRLGICAKTCTRRAECLSMETGCLLKQEAATEVTTIEPAVDTAPEPEQPLQVDKPRPPKPLYIFGWVKDQQLYIGQRGKTWCVVINLDEAARFKNIDAGLDAVRTFDVYKSDIEDRIYNGFLQIFQEGPSGLRPVPRLTRQVSLFDNFPPLEIIEKQPDLIESTDLTIGLYTRDELKLLHFGFILARYDREKKTVQRTRDIYQQGWAPAVPFNTFAAAEKTLKEMLKMDAVIEVTLEGKVNLTTCRNKLFAAGFDFYRTEGIIPGHGHDVPRIKQGSKAWGTWRKYEDPDQLKSAWDELMNDEKALQG